MTQARIPPQNIEAEKAVLGALLLDKNSFDSVVGVVTVRDFYLDSHRVIFEAIMNVYNRNRTADLVLLKNELDRMNKLDAVGGIAYIAALAGDTTAAFNVVHHASIVAEKAQLRSLIEAGNRIISMSYNGDEETAKIVDKAEKLVLDVGGAAKGDNSFVPTGEVLLTTMEHITALQNNKNGITGLRTRFTALDSMTRGLQPSDLIIVAARPSMGKTAFTLNIAQNVALDGKVVAFFSLEMSKEQLVTRLLASKAGIDSSLLQTGQLSEQQWERLIDASVKLGEAPLYIDDTPGLTTQEMRAKLRRLKAEHGLDLIIVDYIQLMQGNASGRGGENRQQEISDISRNLKLIAKEERVPLIALSQLSRAVDSRPDKRPVLSDLRESGSLEQDADIVAFLYRDKYYNETSEKALENGDIAEVIIRKHRNGSLGTVDLLFQGEMTRFMNIRYEEK